MNPQSISLIDLLGFEDYIRSNFVVSKRNEFKLINAPSKMSPNIPPKENSPKSIPQNKKKLKMIF